MSDSESDLSSSDEDETDPDIDHVVELTGVIPQTDANPSDDDKEQDQNNTDNDEDGKGPDDTECIGVAPEYNLR